MQDQFIKSISFNIQSSSSIIALFQQYISNDEVLNQQPAKLFQTIQQFIDILNQIITIKSVSDTVIKEILNDRSINILQFLLQLVASCLQIERLVSFESDLFKDVQQHVKRFVKTKSDVRQQLQIGQCVYSVVSLVFSIAQL